MTIQLNQLPPSMSLGDLGRAVGKEMLIGMSPFRGTIANLRAENTALRDQLFQAQNPQFSAPQQPPGIWSNFMQFPACSGSNVMPQPTVQMINMLSQLMQAMQMGMGSMPNYGSCCGPMYGQFGGCNKGGQDFFRQLQNMTGMMGGLSMAMGALAGMPPMGGGQGMGMGMGMGMGVGMGMGMGIGMGMPMPQMSGMPGGIMPPQVGTGNGLPTIGQPFVPTYDAPNNDRACITTLAKYASKLYPKKGKCISMADIQKMASTGRCPNGSEAPADLRMAAEDLAANPRLFDKLQSANKARRGKADGDGLASIHDLNTLLNDLRTAYPKAPASYNTGAPVQPYTPNAAYGSSFVSSLMSHLQSSGMNPFMLSLLQQQGPKLEQLAVMPR